MHTIIKLPKTINISVLYDNLYKYNVLVDDYRKNYIKDYKHNYKFLKINTANISKDKIDIGLQLIHLSLEKSKLF